MSTFTLALSLLACFEDQRITTEPPAPAPSVALREGAYEIQVLGVDALDCEAVRPQDVVGQRIEANLIVRGEAATLDFEGWTLDGTMSGGALELEGSSVYGGEVEVDDDVDVDASGEDDAAPAATAEEGEPGRDDPPARDELFAAISASVVSDRLADGTLSFDVPGCTMDLEVALLFAGPNRDVPVTEVPDEPREEPGADPCADGADCG